MWVVDHVIKDYRHLMQYSDLKSAGLYGLIQGIEKCREGKGTKPSTYARHWVKAEVLKSLYENKDGMFNSVSGTARSGSSVRRRTKTHQSMIPQFEISLDQGTGTDEAKEGRSDSIELKSSLSSHDIHIKESEELTEHVNFAIATSNLSEFEKLIIAHRFGLSGNEPKTLAEISALTGYTPMGVQKAEKRAIVKLKDNELFKELLT